MDSLLKQLYTASLVYNEPILGKSGAVLPYYVDIKKAYGDPILLRRIAMKMLEQILHDSYPTVIAASGYGGIPLATAIVLNFAHKAKLSLVRDNPKQHGTKALIDGYIPNIGDRAAIVDDVWTSGESINRTAKVIAKTGAKVTGLYVVVNRGSLHIDARYLIHALDLKKGC